MRRPRRDERADERTERARGAERGEQAGPEWNVMRASNGATTWLLSEMVPTTAMANRGNRTSRTRSV